MTGTSASPRARTIDSAWVDRYEDLRKRGFEVGSRWLDGAEGLVVFLRQGMLAWMTDRNAAAPRPPSHPWPPERGAAVPDDRVEVLWMLVSMVGSAVKEVSA